MNAPFGRLYAAETQSFDDRRREQRHPAHFEAFVETSQQRRMPALLADVSLHGCCVQTDEETLRQGSFVSVGLDDASIVLAVVRWVRGNAAGMEFLRAIPKDQTAWHDLMDLSLDR